MEQQSYTNACEKCATLRRTYADAGAEYVGMLKEHQRAAHPDSDTLEELASALKRELYRLALRRHIAKEHQAS